jgi:hypothetical protein
MHLLGQFPYISLSFSLQISVLWLVGERISESTSSPFTGKVQIEFVPVVQQSRIDGAGLSQLNGNPREMIFKRMYEAGQVVFIYQLLAP